MAELIQDTDLELIQDYKRIKKLLATKSYYNKLLNIKRLTFFGDQLVNFTKLKSRYIDGTYPKLSDVEAFYLSNLQETYYGVYLDLKSELEEVDAQTASSFFINLPSKKSEHPESAY